MSEEERHFCAEFAVSSERERADALAAAAAATTTTAAAAPGGVVGGRFRSQALAERFGFEDAAPVTRAADEGVCWLAYVPPPRV